MLADHWLNKQPRLPGDPRTTQCDGKVQRPSCAKSLPIFSRSRKAQVRPRTPRERNVPSGRAHSSIMRLIRQWHFRGTPDDRTIRRTSNRGRDSPLGIRGVPEHAAGRGIPPRGVQPSVVVLYTASCSPPLRTTVPTRASPVMISVRVSGRCCARRD